MFQVLLLGTTSDPTIRWAATPFRRLSLSIGLSASFHRTSFKPTFARSVSRHLATHRYAFDSDRNTSEPLETISASAFAINPRLAIHRLPAWVEQYLHRYGIGDLQDLDTQKPCQLETALLRRDR